MKYQLVQVVDGEFIVSEFSDNADFIAAMEIRGFKFTKMNDNKAHRAELRGEPKFDIVCGPMWGGERDGHAVIRYECPETYRALSE